MQSSRSTNRLFVLIDRFFRLGGGSRTLHRTFVARMCKEDQIPAVSTMYRSDRCRLRHARETERMCRSATEHRSMSVVPHEHSGRRKGLARSSDGHRRVFEKSTSTASRETNQTTAENRHRTRATAVGHAARANEQFETAKEIDDGQMKISLTSIFSIHTRAYAFEFAFLSSSSCFVQNQYMCDFVIL